MGGREGGRRGSCGAGASVSPPGNGAALDPCPAASPRLGFPSKRGEKGMWASRAGGGPWDITVTREPTAPAVF